MSSSVLITGARGFIGRHLVHSLTDEGVETHEPDYGRRIEAGLDCLPSCNHVIHLVGKSHIPDSWKDPVPFYQTNFMGTLQVLEYCRRVGASLTFVSSYLYGQPTSLPTSEDEPLRPASPYAHSKYLAEDIVRFYGNHYQVGFTIVRPFNIYGPGQSFKSLIPEFIQKYMDPEVPEVNIMDARPMRDYLYVSDLVDLLKRTIGRSAGETFNAGSGVAHSPKDVALEIEKSLGIHKRIRIIGEARRNEILMTQADVTKARDLLGWVPHVPFSEGIALTTRYMAGGGR